MASHPYDSHTEERGMLLDAAERAFADLCTQEVITRAEQGEWPAALWQSLEDLGFTRAVLPAAAGGSEFDLADAMRLVRVAARHAVPAPLGETILAAWCLHVAGFEVPEGPLAFATGSPPSAALCLSRPSADQGFWQLDGTLRNLPWAEQTRALMLLLPSDEGLQVLCLPLDHAHMRTRRNLAGEPRGELTFQALRLDDAAVRPWPASAPRIDHASPAVVLGALLRGQQLAGALERVRDLAVRYASERIQFGKPLNKLPAVQQNLAIVAGQSAAAIVAADMALDALSQPDADLTNAVALAKIRAGDAVDLAARLAHQVHGAMGFTYEHQLHLYTRRLWAWRDECGHERYWAKLIGQRIAAQGADALWPFVTQVAQL
ncbi:acyl-CoA dehydrogenase [Paraburkholderia sp. WC7.3g]